MAKLSGGVAVLLLVVVPLSMYTCALLVGIQLGRALERGSDNSSGVDFTWRGALNYVTKELWDIDVLGRRRGGRKASGGVVVVASWSTDVKGLSSSSLREEALESLPELPSANHVLKTKSGAKNTSRTFQRHYNNHTSPRGVISVGPWGGSGGQPFYMHGTSSPRLRSIILYHSGAIHSLSCEYTLDDDHEGPRPPRVAGPWGLSHSYNSRGVRTQIDLRSGEHITAMHGTMGHFANVPGVVITSLMFRTSAGRTYGPYGGVATGSSHHFKMPAADGACIVGFWGRSGWLLDAIGQQAAAERDREMTVKLLGMWASPYVLHVRWALAMKGIEYEYVEEDLRSKSAELLAYNPVHSKVPVLVYHGKPIAESQVILEFIDDAWSHRGDPILPRDPYRRAMARFWARFQHDKLSPPIWRWFTTEGEEQEAAHEAAVEQLLVLEKELAVAGKPFFGGDKVGLVDLSLGPLAYVIPIYEEIVIVTGGAGGGGVREMVTEEKMPCLAAWMGTFLGSPAVKGHLPPVEKLRPRYQAIRESFLVSARAKAEQQQ